jgi:hypothetical protein
MQTSTVLSEAHQVQLQVRHKIQRSSEISLKKLFYLQLGYVTRENFYHNKTFRHLSERYVRTDRFSILF